MATRPDLKQMREILAAVLASNNQIIGVETPSALPFLLSQLAAAPGQVPTSAPVAPSQANQPASGVLPQGAVAGGFDAAAIGQSVRDLILRFAKKYRLVLPVTKADAHR